MSDCNWKVYSYERVQCLGRVHTSDFAPLTRNPLKDLFFKQNVEFVRYMVFVGYMVGKG